MVDSPIVGLHDRTLDVTIDQGVYAYSDALIDALLDVEARQPPATEEAATPLIRLYNSLLDPPKVIVSIVTP